MTWLMTSHDPYGHAPMDMCMHPQHPKAGSAIVSTLTKSARTIPTLLDREGGQKCTTNVGTEFPRAPGMANSQGWHVKIAL